MKQATTDYRTKTTPIVYHTVYKNARVFRYFFIKNVFSAITSSEKPNFLNDKRSIVLIPLFRSIAPL
ncbi:hypothetical protein CRM75_08360 [Enterococcus faecium]|nr:hypothetical protein CRM75_08360 [Enterococcus faecium]